MGAAWRDHGVTIVVALVVLPLVSAMAYRWRRALGRRRTVDQREIAGRRWVGGRPRAGGQRPDAERREAVGRRWAVAEVGLVAGSLPWLVMVFTPQPAPRSVELVPLHDLPTWLGGDFGTAAAQITGNLLVLAALGFFLPMRFAWAASLARVAGVAVVTSSVIEALQWVFAIGRVSSVDDVLVNTLGAVLAAAASRRWWERTDNPTTPDPGPQPNRVQAGS